MVELSRAELSRVARSAKRSKGSSLTLQLSQANADVLSLELRVSKVRGEGVMSMYKSSLVFRYTLFLFHIVV